MPTLSPQLQRAAITLDARPDDIALLSMRELAARTSLAPSTYTRLAHALGFADYAGLREVVVRRLRTRGQERFSRQAQPYLAGKGRSKRTFAQQAQSLRDANIHNLQQHFGAQHRRHRAGGRTAAARAARAPAGRAQLRQPDPFFLLRVAIVQRQDAALVGLGDTLQDSMRFVRAGDVVLAATFDPYTSVVGSALRKAHASGAKIILITDSALAPNSALATVQLTAPVATASFFHSLAAPLATLDALLLAWLQRATNGALAQLGKTDRQLNDDGIYIRSRKARPEAPA